jgi:hypothetical protein
MRRSFLAIIAAIILAPLCFYFGYKLLYPTYIYRYRLSVEVETRDGLRSGSSVIEIRYEMFPKLLTDRDHISRVFGEAVFVDLGQGKNLIGLLAAGPSGEDVDYPGRLVFLAFNLDGNDPNIPKRLPQLRGKRDLDIYHSSLYEVTKRFLPTFVTFRDLHDLSTARIAPPDLFDEIFGTGFKLRNVSIEMTSDPMTSGIEKKMLWWNGPFPWLKPIGGGTYVDTRPQGSFKLTKEQFKREF